MIEMLQQMQIDIEKSTRGSLESKGIQLDPDMEILHWEEGKRNLIEAGPCASQENCDDRCKPNVVICATRLACEALHVCGYRCRNVADPCANRICHSQPVDPR
ncbi:MAG: hypothetical protein ACOY6K_20025 [Pseudomonadota bacterium]